MWQEDDATSPGVWYLLDGKRIVMRRDENVAAVNHTRTCVKTKGQALA